MHRINLLKVFFGKFGAVECVFDTHILADEITGEIKFIAILSISVDKLYRIGTVITVKAEVGYEHLTIHNAWVDSKDYIELDGGTEKSNYKNQNSGVFVVFTEYENAEPEVNGIFTSLNRAQKMKTWLEKYKTKEENGYGNIKSVSLKNMFILD